MKKTRHEKGGSGTPKVYLETSVVSYFASKPSRDLIVLAKQHMTVMWWTQVLPKIQGHVSTFVLEEIEKGDKGAAAERIRICKALPVLQKTDDIFPLAKAYLSKADIPGKAETDAFHIACATIYEMNFLLTWNCTHIANAFVRRKIEAVNRDLGYDTPVICTPEELMEV